MTEGTDAPIVVSMEDVRRHVSDLFWTHVAENMENAGRSMIFTPGENGLNLLEGLLHIEEDTGVELSVVMDRLIEHNAPIEGGVVIGWVVEHLMKEWRKP